MHKYYLLISIICKYVCALFIGKAFNIRLLRQM